MFNVSEHAFYVDKVLGWSVFNNLSVLKSIHAGFISQQPYSYITLHVFSHVRTQPGDKRTELSGLWVWIFLSNRQAVRCQCANLGVSKTFPFPRGELFPNVPSVIFQANFKISAGRNMITELHIQTITMLCLYYSDLWYCKNVTLCDSSHILRPLCWNRIKLAWLKHVTP